MKTYEIFTLVHLCMSAFQRGVHRDFPSLPWYASYDHMHMVVILLKLVDTTYLEFLDPPMHCHGLFHSICMRITFFL